MNERVASLGRASRFVRMQIRRQLARLMSDHRLYQRLFLGPDGEPTPAAAEFFARMGRRGFANASTFHADARVHAMNEGRRALFLETIGGFRLDTARVAALTRQLREADDDE